MTDPPKPPRPQGMNGSDSYIEKLLFRLEDKLESRIARLETFLIGGVTLGVIAFAVEKWLGG